MTVILLKNFARMTVWVYFGLQGNQKNTLVDVAYSMLQFEMCSKVSVIGSSRSRDQDLPPLLDRFLQVPIDVLEHIVRRGQEFDKILAAPVGGTQFDFAPYLPAKLRSNAESELYFCLLTANFRADKSILIQKELNQVLGVFKKGGSQGRRTGRGLQGEQDVSDAAVNNAVLHVKISTILARHGHRFVNQRTERIINARKYVKHVTTVLAEYRYRAFAAQTETNSAGAQGDKQLSSDLTRNRRNLARHNQTRRYKYTNRNNTGLATTEHISQIRTYVDKMRNQLLQIRGLGLKEASHFLRNVGVQQIAIIDRHILRFLQEQTGWHMPTKTLTEKTYKLAEQQIFSLSEKLHAKARAMLQNLQNTQGQDVVLSRSAAVATPATQAPQTAQMQLSQKLKLLVKIFANPGLFDLLIFYFQTGAVLK